MHVENFVLLGIAAPCLLLCCLAVYVYIKSQEFTKTFDDLSDEFDQQVLDAVVVEVPAKVGQALTAIEESEKAEGDFEAPIQSIQDVPQCVQDYFAHAIRDTRQFSVVEVTQHLQLRFKPGGKWVPAIGSLRASPLVPAFIFKGSLSMMPLLPTNVTGFESLVGGRGRMQWRLWGALRLAGHEGELIDRAARVRWLTEAVSFPQALLPSRWVRWEGVDGATDEARAVLNYQGVAVSAVFTFDNRHNVVGVRSEEYCRSMPGGKVARCGLRGSCKGHMLFGLSPQSAMTDIARHTSDGMVIPTETEASFVSDDGTEVPFIKVLTSRALAK